MANQRLYLIDEEHKRIKYMARLTDRWSVSKTLAEWMIESCSFRMIEEHELPLYTNDEEWEFTSM